MLNAHPTQTANQKVNTKIKMCIAIQANVKLSHVMIHVKNAKKLAVLTIPKINRVPAHRM